MLATLSRFMTHSVCMYVVWCWNNCVAFVRLALLIGGIVINFSSCIVSSAVCRERVRSVAAPVREWRRSAARAYDRFLPVLTATFRLPNLITRFNPHEHSAGGIRDRGSARSSRLSNSQRFVNIC